MNTHHDLTRRHLLRGAAGSAALASLAPFTSLSVAAATAGVAGTARSDNKLVFFILRGGLDGLTAVPAIGDPAFAEARGGLAEFPSAALPLQGPFALHPLLPELHQMYSRGEMTVLHAVGLPYRERSHFDAQQVLESGGTRPLRADHRLAGPRAARRRWRAGPARRGAGNRRAAGAARPGRG